MNPNKLILTALLAGVFSVVHAGEDMNAKVTKLVAESFKPGEGQDLSRLVQDETQKVCSTTRNNPTAAQAAAINAREQATIKYPDGNKLVGDWKNGEKLVKGGFGMRIGSIEPDKVERQNNPNGGNCYACHQLAAKEIAYGNLGPSLTGYGKQRGQSAEMLKYTWTRLWNSHAYNACSHMPRFGDGGILTEQQLKDVMALLFDPASPVNQ